MTKVFGLLTLIVFMSSCTAVKEYEKEYIKEHPKQFLSFTMPVSPKAYTDKHLFSFFEGLIPEGWLLDIASKNWKINQNDRMGLLLACCKNTIGAVSVHPVNENADV